MDREILRRHFSALLMDTNNEHHLKCTINDSKDRELSLSAFQDSKEGIIFFCLYGDCIVEFDDLETDDLIVIFNTLKEKYNIQTKVID